MTTYRSLRSLAGIITHDWGAGFGGVVGHCFADRQRTEGDLRYRKNDFDAFTMRERGRCAALLPPDKQEPAALDGLRGVFPMDCVLSSASLRLNLHCDFDISLALKPQVGEGIGLNRIVMASASFGGQIIDVDDIVLANWIGSGPGCAPVGSDDRLVIINQDFRDYETAEPAFKVSVTAARFDSEVDRELCGRRPAVCTSNETWAVEDSFRGTQCPLPHRTGRRGPLAPDAFRGRLAVTAKRDAKIARLQSSRYSMMPSRSAPQSSILP